AAETAAAGKTPLLAVLGSGCSRCKELLANTREALSAQGIAVEPEYITDLKTIMSFGVMSLPALVIRGRTVSAGRVLKPAEIGKLLHENFA
ncbi:MAG: thioredoxin family protein, partial [Pyramidobacter sp.]|nr:thioredoxin family protein [Pyramidobacter sp.]